jgi:hypothetical protein
MTEKTGACLACEKEKSKTCLHNAKHGSKMVVWAAVDSPKEWVNWGRPCKGSGFDHPEHKQCLESTRLASMANGLHSLGELVGNFVRKALVSSARFVRAIDRGPYCTTRSIGAVCGPGNPTDRLRSF